MFSLTSLVTEYAPVLPSGVPYCDNAAVSAVCTTWFIEIDVGVSGEICNKKSGESDDI